MNIRVKESRYGFEIDASGKKTSGVRDKEQKINILQLTVIKLVK